jgi:UDP-N-acetylmuramoyl-tripeptide--D-alanyl-D-alanine ligase
MLGDMLELGEDSLAEHVAVIKSVAGRSMSATYFVGKEFTAASAEVTADELAGMRFFTTSDELAQHLTEHPLEGATVLVKGSRGTRMEKVIPVL